MVRGEKRGFEVSSPGDMASLYQTFGIPGDQADELVRQSGLFGNNQPAPDIGTKPDVALPVASQPEQARDVQINAGLPPIGSVGQPPAPGPAPQTNTAAMQVDMLGEGGIPAAGAGNDLYRSPNQRTMENIINPAGRAIKNWAGGIQNPIPSSPDEDVYALMGQRGRQ